MDSPDHHHGIVGIDHPFSALFALAGKLYCFSPLPGRSDPDPQVLQGAQQVALPGR